MLRLSILSALAQVAAQITNLTQQGEPPSRPLSGSLTGDEIVANCFTSLRTIGTHDWPHFFESVSRVEQILREDPAAVYAGMDRATATTCWTMGAGRSRIGWATSPRQE